MSFVRCGGAFIPLSRKRLHLLSTEPCVGLDTWKWLLPNQADSSARSFYAIPSKWQIYRRFDAHQVPDEQAA